MAAEPSPIADQSSGNRSPPPPPTADNSVETPAAAWKKPSTSTAADGDQFIANEESWPALSEATRNQFKSAVDPPLGSTSQATRNQSKSAVDPPPMSTSQAHLISNLKKSLNTNQNHKPSGNQTSTHSRQRKRGGGSSSVPSQNGVNHHPRPLPVPRQPPPPAALRTPLPPPPPFPPSQIYDGSFSPFFFPPSVNSNNWERGPVRGFLPQLPPVSDQHFQRNFSPMRSFVGRPRGDGGGNSSYVARGDHHRDRNSTHKGFARPSRAQAPPPPPLPPFPMASIIPFRNPVGFDIAHPYANFPPPYPEYMLRFAPPAPLPPFVIHPMVSDLPSMLIKQIDHYFSDDNLAKDTYLRSKMDGEGWVDIAFIADFPMVKQKTMNLQLILDSLRDSTVVEVQDNRIRRRNNWRKWLISVPQSSIGSSSQTHSDLAENMLTSSLKGAVLADEIPCDGKADLSSNVATSGVAI